ncbi:DUF6538 domain-containing protein [Paracraurococcus lichenis]|uniref:Core-binding (CB) domain-containing protein n=1 Tax=Paracraurococcus lichenis TaxID=3064888 RepID=A0ABT9EC69_9PROT|nr:DUF6538 domain-containing protein [Paracraurococcus sp. LOR1-02]MDO9713807.1 hypothetical protein [Paracraurococcus sp. LOR1-02]
MSRPIRRASGDFAFRARVPADVQAVAGKKFYSVALVTKDPAEAKRRHREEEAIFTAKIAEWRRQSNRVDLTREQATEIAARWAAALKTGAIQWDAAGGTVPALASPQSEGSTEHPPLEGDSFEARLAAHVMQALALAGLTATDSGWRLLRDIMVPLARRAHVEAGLRAWATPGTLDRAAAAKRGVLEPISLSIEPRSPIQPSPGSRPATPNPPAQHGPTAREGVTFDELIRGWSRITAAKPRTVDDTRMILNSLKRFLGHDDAGAVTTAALKRWRDDALDRGLTNNTFNNRLSMIRQVFAWGVKDGQLPSDPTEGLRLPKSKNAQRFPYSDEQMVQILLASRSEKAAGRRWAHWIMAFTGMRAGEVLQLSGADVRQDPATGVWYIAVNEDDEGKSVKNGQTRHVPLHPALICEGFVTFAQTVAASAPLFPDKKCDKFGRRGGRAWNYVGKWIRETVGITDERLAPDHSWRHRMEDELRAAEVPSDARNAIVGHADQSVGRVYGLRGESLARLYRELSKVQVPKGLFPEDAAPVHAVPRLVHAM